MCEVFERVTVHPALTIHDVTQTSKTAHQNEIIVREQGHSKS